MGNAHRPATLACSCLLVALAGCTNPLASDAMDYTPIATPERVRQIDGLDVDAFRAPAPEDEADAEERREQVADAVRNRFQGLERYELDIASARAATLANNLGLMATLVDPAIAAEGVAIEEGRFESVFTLDGVWSETDTPTATTLTGSGTRSQSITPGLRVPLRTGGTATVSLPINRFETDNLFSTLNPSVATDLEFSLSHNLLRGAGRRATTHQVRIADLNRQITEAQTKLEVIRQVAAADRAYWRLYAAQQALEVRVEAYSVAVEQLASGERKLRAGTGPEIDVVRAQSEVANRVEAVIRAQNTVLLRQRELKQVINVDGLDVDSVTLIMPVSDPEPVRYVFDAAELSAAAVDNRMEMLELELRLASDAANIAFQRNQALPLFAMAYTYRVNGLGGTSGDAFDLLYDNNFEDWSVSLNAEIPLGNEQRRSQLAQSILTRLQRLSTRDQRRQSIVKEVYDAIDQLQTDWQRILASRDAVALSARQLAAERRQFDVGRSNALDVLDANRQLLEARLTEIEAVVDYQISQVDLAFATGTLLGQAKVEWAPSDPREGPGDDADAPGLRYRPWDGVLTRD